MSISSNIASAPAYSAVNAYQNILRLPTLPQLSPSNNIAHYFNSRISKSNECDQKAQEIVCPNGSSNVKRKRSWSRAVFSNLQRKGLERQFEFQKYITKPDRKKLAARLGLKDAQVKVWFQVSSI
jgi:Homeodomain